MTNSATPLGATQVVERLLAEPETPQSIPVEFLKDIATRFQNDDLENILQPIVAGIGAKARTATILTDWRTPLRALLTLIEIPEFAAAIPRIGSWNPTNATAPQIAIVSALGPFFKTSGFLLDDVSLSLSCYMYFIFATIFPVN